MTTRTINTIGCTTQNSRNAGTSSGIAFGRHILTMVPIVVCNSHTASDSPNNDQNPPGDREPEDGGPGRPNEDPSDDGNNDGPRDPFNPSENSDHPDEENVQHNLADVIAALARNVQHQGDGSCSKVQGPNPFNGTDTTKLWTFLVQLQLNFNDQPHTFSEDRRKVNFTISYLKGIVLAHFKIHSSNQT